MQPLSSKREPPGSETAARGPAGTQGCGKGMDSGLAAGAWGSLPPPHTCLCSEGCCLSADEG